MLLLELSPLELAYCIGVLLLNFALRGSLGFGGALGLPLLALVLPVKVLAPAWSLVGIVSSAAIVGKGRRHVDWQEFRRLLPGCASASSPACSCSRRSTPRFSRARSASSSSSTPRIMVGASRPSKQRVLSAPFASVLSGIVGTVFGAMATIFFAMFLDAGKLAKDAFRATMSAMILTISVARTIGYAAVGELTLDSVILCAASIPAMGIGLLVGDRLHTGLSERAFQRVVCVLLAICGVALWGWGP